MKITEKEFNVVTSKETMTERDETAPEIAKRQKVEIETEIRAAAEAEVKTAKAVAQAKLAALGLTTDDLKALGL